MLTVNGRSVLLDKIPGYLPNDEYHTSVADMSPKDILTIAKKFDSINFISDNFTIDDSLYKETIILLTYLQHHLPVANFTADSSTTFVDFDVSTRSNDPTLWIFGCSHSHGCGLPDNALPYGKIISNELDMPLNLITKPGSSTRWSLRHLINASIRATDLVVWQITTPDRISLPGTPPIEVMLSHSTDRTLLTTYTDEQIYFDHLSLINYGVQYLRAKGIKFLLTSIEQDSSLFYEYKKEYVKYKEYCYSPGFNVDLSTDNIHFGEISHKNLAFSLLNHVQCMYGKFI